MFGSYFGQDADPEKQQALSKAMMALVPLFAGQGKAGAGAGLLGALGAGYMDKQAKEGLAEREQDKKGMDHASRMMLRDLMLAEMDDAQFNAYAEASDAARAKDLYLHAPRGSGGREPLRPAPRPRGMPSKRTLDDDDIEVPYWVIK